MYVAFLRGINVSGKNKIVMSDLVKSFENQGFLSVKHYLNTGNIVFNVENASSTIKSMEQSITEMIRNEFDLNIHVIVLSKKDLVQITEAYPFESEDGKNMYVTLMQNPPIPELSSSIESVKKPVDSFLITGNVLYLYVPSGYGKSKLSNNFIEKKGQVTATTRNINTFKKLQNML